MGNKSPKAKPDNPPNILYTIPLVKENVVGKNNTIKSILRNNNSKDSSSMSSNSSVSKQNVTFSDEIINDWYFIEESNSGYNDNFTKLRVVPPFPLKMNNQFSSSTETLKPTNNDRISSMRSDHSVSHVQISYAKDYKVRKNLDIEPLKSECELMPAYSATFAVRLRPFYHSTISIDKANESQTLKIKKISNNNNNNNSNNSRPNIIQSNIFQTPNKDFRTTSNFINTTTDYHKHNLNKSFERIPKAQKL